ncbi:MAG: HAD family hydrolase, partial [Candidatus Omnitrophica bacterium]|nr:HAD family hydrolase [Candidatus Omnitrophota bacterium]
MRPKSTFAVPPRRPFAPIVRVIALVLVQVFLCTSLNPVLAAPEERVAPRSNATFPVIATLSLSKGKQSLRSIDGHCPQGPRHDEADSHLAIVSTFDQGIQDILKTWLFEHAGMARIQGYAQREELREILEAFGEQGRTSDLIGLFMLVASLEDSAGLDERGLRALISWGKDAHLGERLIELDSVLDIDDRFIGVLSPEAYLRFSTWREGTSSSYRATLGKANAERESSVEALAAKFRGLALDGEQRTAAQIALCEAVIDPELPPGLRIRAARAVGPSLAVARIVEAPKSELARMIQAAEAPALSFLSQTVHDPSAGQLRREAAEAMHYFGPGAHEEYMKIFGTGDRMLQLVAQGYLADLVLRDSPLAARSMVQLHQERRIPEGLDRAIAAISFVGPEGLELASELINLMGGDIRQTESAWAIIGSVIARSDFIGSDVVINAVVDRLDEVARESEDSKMWELCSTAFQFCFDYGNPDETKVLDVGLELSASHPLRGARIHFTETVPYWPEEDVYVARVIGEFQSRLAAPAEGTSREELMALSRGLEVLKVPLGSRMNTVTQSIIEDAEIAPAYRIFGNALDPETLQMSIAVRFLSLRHRLVTVDLQETAALEDMLHALADVGSWEVAIKMVQMLKSGVSQEDYLRLHMSLFQLAARNGDSTRALALARALNDSLQDISISHWFENPYKARRFLRQKLDLLFEVQSLGESDDVTLLSSRIRGQVWRILEQWGNPLEWIANEGEKGSFWTDPVALRTIAVALSAVEDMPSPFEDLSLLEVKEELFGHLAEVDGVANGMGLQLRERQGAVQVLRLAALACDAQKAGVSSIDVNEYAAHSKKLLLEDVGLYQMLPAGEILVQSCTYFLEAGVSPEWIAEFVGEVLEASGLYEDASNFQDYILSLIPLVGWVIEKGFLRKEPESALSQLVPLIPRLVSSLESAIPVDEETGLFKRYMDDVSQMAIALVRAGWVEEGRKLAGILEMPHALRVHTALALEEGGLDYFRAVAAVVEDPKEGYVLPENAAAHLAFELAFLRRSSEINTDRLQDSLERLSVAEIDSFFDHNPSFPEQFVKVLAPELASHPEHRESWTELARLAGVFGEDISAFQKYMNLGVIQMIQELPPVFGVRIVSMSVALVELGMSPQYLVAYLKDRISDIRMRDSAGRASLNKQDTESNLELRQLWESTEDIETFAWSVLSRFEDDSLSSQGRRVPYLQDMARFTGQLASLGPRHFPESASEFLRRAVAAQRLLTLQLRDSGNAASTFTRFADNLLDAQGPAQLLVPPEPFPQESQIDRGPTQRELFVPTTELSDLINPRDFEFIETQGRKAIYRRKADDRYFTVKVLKEGEAPTLLAAENERHRWFNEHRDTLGLEANYPIPIPREGEFWEGEEWRRWIFTTEQLPFGVADLIVEEAAREGEDLVLSNSEGEGYQVIVQELVGDVITAGENALPGELIYLDDPSIDEEIFWEALERNVHDLFVLASYGIIHHALVELFHQSQFSNRPDVGRFLPWVDTLRPMRTREGMGNLHRWTREMMWENMRVACTMDWADAMALKELVDPDNRVSRHLNSGGILDGRNQAENQREYPENFYLAHYLQIYQLIAALTVGSRYRQRGGFDFPEELQSLRNGEPGALARRFESLTQVAYQAFTGRSLENVDPAIWSQIFPLQQMVTQMAWILPEGDAYAQDLLNETALSEIWGLGEVVYEKLPASLGSNNIYVHSRGWITPESVRVGESSWVRRPPTGERYVLMEGEKLPRGWYDEEYGLERGGAIVPLKMGERPPQGWYVESQGRLWPNLGAVNGGNALQGMAQWLIQDAVLMVAERAGGPSLFGEVLSRGDEVSRRAAIGRAVPGAEREMVVEGKARVREAFETYDPDAERASSMEPQVAYGGAGYVIGLENDSVQRPEQLVQAEHTVPAEVLAQVRQRIRGLESGLDPPLRYTGNHYSGIPGINPQPEDFNLLLIPDDPTDTRPMHERHLAYRANEYTQIGRASERRRNIYLTQSDYEALLRDPRALEDFLVHETTHLNHPWEREHKIEAFAPTGRVWAALWTASLESRPSMSAREVRSFLEQELFEQMDALTRLSDSVNVLDGLLAWQHALRECVQDPEWAIPGEYREEIASLLEEQWTEASLAETAAERLASWVRAVPDTVTVCSALKGLVGIAERGAEAGAAALALEDLRADLDVEAGILERALSGDALTEEYGDAPEHWNALEALVLLESARGLWCVAATAAGARYRVSALSSLAKLDQKLGTRTLESLLWDSESSGSRDSLMEGLESVASALAGEPRLFAKTVQCEPALLALVARDTPEAAHYWLLEAAGQPGAKDRILQLIIALHRDVYANHLGVSVFRVLLEDLISDRPSEVLLNVLGVWLATPELGELTVLGNDDQGNSHAYLHDAVLNWLEERIRIRELEVSPGDRVVEDWGRSWMLQDRQGGLYVRKGLFLREDSAVARNQSAARVLGQMTLVNSLAAAAMAEEPVEAVRELLVPVHVLETDSGGNLRSDDGSVGYIPANEQPWVRLGDAETARNAKEVVAALNKASARLAERWKIGFTAQRLVDFAHAPRRDPYTVIVNGERRTIPGTARAFLHQHAIEVDLRIFDSSLNDLLNSAPASTGEIPWPARLQNYPNIAADGHLVDEDSYLGHGPHHPTSPAYAASQVLFEMIWVAVRAIAGNDAEVLEDLRRGDPTRLVGYLTEWLDYHWVQFLGREMNRKERRDITARLTEYLGDPDNDWVWLPRGESQPPFELVFRNREQTSGRKRQYGDMWAVAWHVGKGVHSQGEGDVQHNMLLRLRRALRAIQNVSEAGLNEAGPEFYAVVHKEAARLKESGTDGNAPFREIALVEQDPPLRLVQPRALVLDWQGTLVGEHGEVLPGVREWLSEAYEAAPIRPVWIVSSMPQKELADAVQASELQQFCRFGGILGVPEDDPAILFGGEPKRVLFETVARMLQRKDISPSQVVAFGDETADIVLARATGFRAFGVSALPEGVESREAIRRRHVEGLENAGAEAVVGSLPEVRLIRFRDLSFSNSEEASMALETGHNTETEADADRILREGIERGDVVRFEDAAEGAAALEGQRVLWQGMLGDGAGVFFELFDHYAAGEIDTDAAVPPNAILFVKHREESDSAYQKLRALGMLGHNGGRSLFVLEGERRRPDLYQVIQQLEHAYMDLGRAPPVLELGPDAILAHEWAAVLGADEYQSQLVTLASLMTQEMPPSAVSAIFSDEQALSRGFAELMELDISLPASRTASQTLAKDLQAFLKQVPHRAFLARIRAGQAHAGEISLDDFGKAIQAALTCPNARIRGLKNGERYILDAQIRTPIFDKESIHSEIAIDLYKDGPRGLKPLAGAASPQIVFSLYKGQPFTLHCSRVNFGEALGERLFPQVLALIEALCPPETVFSGGSIINTPTIQSVCEILLDKLQNELPLPEDIAALQGDLALLSGKEADLSQRNECALELLDRILLALSQLPGYRGFEWDLEIPLGAKIPIPISHEEFMKTVLGHSHAQLASSDAQVWVSRTGPEPGYIQLWYGVRLVETPGLPDRWMDGSVPSAFSEFPSNAGIVASVHGMDASQADLDATEAGQRVREIREHLAQHGRPPGEWEELSADGPYAELLQQLQKYWDGPLPQINLGTLPTDLVNPEAAPSPLTRRILLDYSPPLGRDSAHGLKVNRLLLWLKGMEDYLPADVEQVLGKEPSSLTDQEMESILAAAVLPHFIFALLRGDKVYLRPEALEWFLSDEVTRQWLALFLESVSAPDAESRLRKQRRFSQLMEEVVGYGMRDPQQEWINRYFGPAEPVVIPATNPFHHPFNITHSSAPEPAEQALPFVTLVKANFQPENLARLIQLGIRDLYVASAMDSASPDRTLVSVSPISEIGHDIYSSPGLPKGTHAVGLSVSHACRDWFRTDVGSGTKIPGILPIVRSRTETQMMHVTSTGEQALQTILEQIQVSSSHKYPEGWLDTIGTEFNSLIITEYGWSERRAALLSMVEAAYLNGLPIIALPDEERDLEAFHKLRDEIRTHLAGVDPTGEFRLREYDGRWAELTGAIREDNYFGTAEEAHTELESGHNTDSEKDADRILREGIARGEVMRLADVPEGEGLLTAQRAQWQRWLEDNAASFLELFDHYAGGGVDMDAAVPPNAILYVPQLIPGTDEPNPTHQKLRELGMLGHNGGRSLFVLEGERSRPDLYRVIQQLEHAYMDLGRAPPVLELGPDAILAHEWAAVLGADEYQSQLVTLAALLPPEISLVDAAALAPAIAVLLNVRVSDCMVFAQDLVSFLEEAPERSVQALLRTSPEHLSAHLSNVLRDLPLSSLFGEPLGAILTRPWPRDPNAVAPLSVQVELRLGGRQVPSFGTPPSLYLDWDGINPVRFVSDASYLERPAAQSSLEVLSAVLEACPPETKILFRPLYAEWVGHSLGGVLLSALLTQQRGERLSPAMVQALQNALEAERLARTADPADSFDREFDAIEAWQAYLDLAAGEVQGGSGISEIVFDLRGDFDDPGLWTELIDRTLLDLLQEGGVSGMHWRADLDTETWITLPQLSNDLLPAILSPAILASLGSGEVGLSLRRRSEEQGDIELAVGVTARGDFRRQDLMMAGIRQSRPDYVERNACRFYFSHVEVARDWRDYIAQYWKWIEAEDRDELESAFCSDAMLRQLIRYAQVLPFPYMTPLGGDLRALTLERLREASREELVQWADAICRNSESSFSRQTFKGRVGSYLFAQIAMLGYLYPIGQVPEELSAAAESLLRNVAPAVGVELENWESVPGVLLAQVPYWQGALEHLD